MDRDADRRLDLRLVPADDRPADPQVLDDLVRLVRQGIATAAKEVPPVTAGADFRPPTPEEREAASNVEGRVKHRIEQATRESEADVERWKQLEASPDKDARRADEARKAAERVVAAVQRALIVGVCVRPPDDPPRDPAGG